MDKSHKLLLASWQIAAAGIIASLGILAVFWNQIPPLTPLFYSLPWGIDQLVPKYLTFLIPTLILFIQTLNQIVFSLNSEEALLRKLSNIVSIVSALMLTLGLVRIVLLIT